MTINYFRRLPSFLECKSLADKAYTTYYDFQAAKYHKKDIVAHSFYECMKCLCMANGCFSYTFKQLWIEWAARYYIRAIRNGGKTKGS